MLPHLFERAKALTLKLLDESGGDLSLHEIAKRLNNDLGTPIQPGELAGIRAQWFASARAQVLANLRQERVREKLTGPKCSNCGGEHYRSQCMEPVKKKEEEEEPIQLTEVQAPAPTTQEHTMTDETQQPQQQPTFHRPPPDQPPPALVHEHHLGRQKVKGVWIRRAYLNEILDASPGIDPQLAIARVRERFGLGIEVSYVYETCRVARQIARLEPIPEKAASYQREDPNGREPFNREVEEGEEDVPLQEEMTALAQQARQVMRAHGLTELKLTLDESTARWSFKIERSGEGEVTL